MQTHDRVMLDVKDIMRIMGIGRDKAYDLLHSKQFPIVKVGRRILVHRDNLFAWLRGERVQ